MIKRGTVRSATTIAALAMVPAIVGLLTTPPASAAPATTTSADLGVTMSPMSQHVTNWGPPVHMVFSAVVTNIGPDVSDQVVVTAPSFRTGFETASVGFSVSPAESCNTSAGTFTCPQLPVGGTITARIELSVFCIPYVCEGSTTVTASAATPDPNLANNSASGGWGVTCYMLKNCY